MKNIKYSILCFLISSQYLSSTSLTVSMLAQIIQQKAERRQNLSNAEKRIIDLVSSIEHHKRANKELWLNNFRATRWGSDKNQKSILEHESFIWEDGGNLPVKWPSMIHRFSKKIDQEILSAGYFSIYQNPKNTNDKSNVSVVVPCMVYLTNQKNIDLQFPGMLEYGFDKNNVCFHRCFRGLGWKNYENSFNKVRHLAKDVNGKLDWNRDKFADNSIFDNDLAFDKMKIQIYNSFEAAPVSPNQN